jgi:hypothetical protein
MSEDRICVACGNPFTLTDEEVEYFSSKIMDRKVGSPTYGQEIQMFPPKRCKNCRIKKKAEQSRQ